MVWFNWPISLWFPRSQWRRFPTRQRNSVGSTPVREYSFVLFFFSSFSQNKIGALHLCINLLWLKSTREGNTFFSFLLNLLFLLIQRSVCFSRQDKMTHHVHPLLPKEVKLSKCDLCWCWWRRRRRDDDDNIDNDNNMTFKCRTTATLRRLIEQFSNDCRR